MPKKNVWEMSAMERMHYSLSGKTFRAIILMSLIISMAAVSFGFYLYTSTVNREYRVMTWRMAASASELIDADESYRNSTKVLSVYEHLPEYARGDGYDTGYLSQFGWVQDAQFETLRQKIHALQVKNEAVAAYVAALDPDTSRMIYIVDGDPNADTFCPPGSWDLLREDELNAYLHGAEPSLLDRLYGTGAMTSYLLNMEKYGYRCTAGAKLFEIGKYPVYIFFDTDMNRVADVSRSFLWQYTTYLLLVTIVVAFFGIRHLKKNTVKPINDLARAAYAYVTDKRDHHSTGAHFSDLNIRTGDEIENLSLTMQEMERELASYVQSLTQVTAEKERISTELELANRIQADMLPNIFPAFPDRPDFDIYASMTPAKEVGGDFYDYFLIDDTHLGLVMADVSGKGVPAALFMMVSKILVQNFAMTGRSPKQVLEAVNAQICANNREQMFVTIWFGILDLSSGKLTAANAGHEYPVIKKRGGEFEVVKDKHGFVIGGMDGIKYREYELDMEPGAKLFLYTDGVPEASNARDELFGMERMTKALNRAKEGSPEEILSSVDDAVKVYVGSAPQFDDLTMMCVHYIGRDQKVSKPAWSEITVDAVLDKLGAVTEFVDSELEKLDCPLKAQMQIDIAVDELFSNIARYAYAPDTGRATIRIERESVPSAVRITFIDHGVPYNPLSMKDPDTSLSAEERVQGGLGVFLVKKTMDGVSYQYKDGSNMLTIRKEL